MKKVWFFNKWVLLRKLKRRLKKMGFKEGVDFGEAWLEYTGFPIIEDKQTKGGKTLEENK